VSVCSELVNETSGVLNANSSKTVKAMDFRFNAHVFMDAPHYPLNIFSKRGMVRVT